MCRKIRKVFLGRTVNKTEPFFKLKGQLERDSFLAYSVPSGLGRKYLDFFSSGPSLTEVGHDLSHLVLLFPFRAFSYPTYLQCALFLIHLLYSTRSENTLVKMTKKGDAFRACN